MTAADGRLKINKSVVDLDLELIWHRLSLVRGWLESVLFRCIDRIRIKALSDRTKLRRTFRNRLHYVHVLRRSSRIHHHSEDAGSADLLLAGLVGEFRIDLIDDLGSCDTVTGVIYPRSIRIGLRGRSSRFLSFYFRRCRSFSLVGPSPGFGFELPETLDAVIPETVNKSAVVIHVNRRIAAPHYAKGTPSDPDR